PRPPRSPAEVSEARSRGDRVDQQPDAVHDEGDLRAVLAAARRPGDRKHELRLLLLQPGPAARPGRLRRPRPALGAERRAAKAHPARERALSQAAPAARRAQGRLAHSYAAAARILLFTSAMKSRRCDLELKDRLGMM